MNSTKLVDAPINIKLILSALWASVVLIYLYADLFAFYVPGHLEEAIAGEIGGMQISELVLLLFMVFMVIPSAMVILSLILKAKVNRWTNILVSVFQLVLVVPSVVGDSNIYFMFASSVETILLALIIYFAWTWPTEE